MQGKGKASKKRYLQIQNDRAYRLAVKKLAGDEGLSTTDFIAKLVKAAHPEIDELVRKFDKAQAREVDHAQG